jgi:hypothetical protein
MNYVNFISERDYLLSAGVHNNDIVDDNQDDICYLQTKYGKDNLHNLIKSNRSYKNKYRNILDHCEDCDDSSPYTYLDNGLNCLTCTNNFKYLSKNEEQYAELINRYIIELEALKTEVDDNTDRFTLKKDLVNLYQIKNTAYKKSLEYLNKYKNKICKNKKKVLQCYSFNDEVNNLIHKINISNIELVYIVMNHNNKDTTEILDLLNEYKLTYNSDLFKKIKVIEKQNTTIEKFSNTEENNYFIVLFLLLILFYFSIKK